MEYENITENDKKSLEPKKFEGRNINCPHCGSGDTTRYDIQGEDDMIECNECGLVFIPNESGLLDVQFLTIKGHADCDASCCSVDDQEDFMEDYKEFSEYEVVHR